MTQFQPEDGAKLKRRWVEQAVSLAMQNRWEEAAAINRRILEQFPNDVDAYNRLGRALMELGRYSEAREAYGKSVERDPHNTIAKKNLSRLSLLTEEAGQKAREQVDPRLFIAETGKTGVTALVRPAAREVFAKMAVGDKVYLQPEGGVLTVRNASNEFLGQVETKLGLRLAELMRGGNDYAAALMSIEDNNVRIIIRETLQHPSQSGKVSFPAKEALGVRSYIRESLVRADEDEEEDLEEGEDLDTEEAEEHAEEPEFEPEEGSIGE